jgi:hypothetical protein
MKEQAGMEVDSTTLEDLINRAAERASDKKNVEGLIGEEAMAWVAKLISRLPAEVKSFVDDIASKKANNGIIVTKLQLVLKRSSDDGTDFTDKEFMQRAYLLKEKVQYVIDNDLAFNIHGKVPRASLEAKKERKPYIAAGAKFLNVISRNFKRPGTVRLGITLTWLCTAQWSTC